VYDCVTECHSMDVSNQGNYNGRPELAIKVLIYNPRHKLNESHLQVK
jgi:hypothetical protein